MVGHDVRECVGDVTTFDDLLCLPSLVGEQQETEDNTPKEDPFTDTKVNRNASFFFLKFRWAALGNLI